MKRPAVAARPTAARWVPVGHSWAFRDHRTLAEVFAEERVAEVAMDARDLAGLNGQLAIQLRARRAAGATGSDEDLTNAILRSHGGAEIDIRPLLARLRRRSAADRRGKHGAGPAPKVDTVPHET
jgi:hypothetical protein